MKRILFILLLTFGLNANAQNNENNLDKFGKIELGLHGLTFGYELPVSNKFVWENGIGIGMGMSVPNGAKYTLNFARPVPFLKSRLKFVYNIQKRKEKGKNILNNAGNYIALQTKYSFGNSNSFDLNSSMLTELHWGIQRNLGGRFIFNTHIGIGYLRDFDLNGAAISPSLGFSFGYRIF